MTVAEPPEVIHCGDDALRIGLPDVRTCQAVARELRASGDWLEVVSGWDSVTVRYDCLGIAAADAARRLMTALESRSGASHNEQSTIIVPVCYAGQFGPDFDRVCEISGLDHAEFIALHTGCEHVVEMLGFTPGFAYVSGLPADFAISRRGQPRQRVAAGSIGLAGNLSGLYALAGPGGWQVIGRTPIKLFEARRESPFLLSPGTRIRFEAITSRDFAAREGQ